MPDDPPGHDTDAPDLTAAEMAHLANLGACVRSAPGYRAVQEALDAALAAASRHRQDGVGWAAITRALGVPEAELRHRMEETTGKAHERPRPPAAPRSIGTKPVHNLPPVTATTMSLNQLFSDSRAALAPQHATLSPRLPAHDALAPLGVAGRVLFLSGDPRPGRNDFGSEAACIRQSLVGSLVRVREMAAVGLPEICPALDEHTPAILHIAAHSSFGGIHLTQDGGGLCNTHADLSAQIARARFPPRLVVLNLCDSALLAAHLSKTIATAIGWDHTLDDRQAQVFTRQFYRSLSGRRSVGDSCEDAEAALSGPHPECPPPESHGDTGSSVL
ncbi:CHAT domain-containing protein [Streptomyces humi]|uniref:CHAT domain-containing protein n=1 Tax=Streptomyces humi TaxID=1428620 RepID=UPI00062899B8|nr:CHAT domain-containing protein [Streptomyces humi]